MAAGSYKINVTKLLFVELYHSAGPVLFILSVPIILLLKIVHLPLKAAELYPEEIDRFEQIELNEIPEKKLLEVNAFLEQLKVLGFEYLCTFRLPQLPIEGGTATLRSKDRKVYAEIVYQAVVKGSISEEKVSWALSSYAGAGKILKTVQNWQVAPLKVHPGSIIQTGELGDISRSYEVHTRRLQQAESSGEFVPLAIDFEDFMRENQENYRQFVRYHCQRGLFVRQSAAS